MDDPAQSRGWTRYGFDDAEFFLAHVHGSEETMQVAQAFSRGYRRPHVSFGVVPARTTSAPIGMHVHRDMSQDRDVEEWYVIISGRGEMTFSNGDVITVGAGDFVATYPGTGHSFRAAGSEPVRLVAILPEMFTAPEVWSDLPDEFSPRVRVAAVDPSTMSPLGAACSECAATWSKPPHDAGSESLAAWARDHDCASVC